ncbi:hypothetical protein R4Z10_09035 [Niallia sp. XMNu-256]|uniref:hypothetical protein n=1 Tax=Niallia sp. XMNu-256 TaxID=3082444 RepID=UPI0030D0E0FA
MKLLKGFSILLFGVLLLSACSSESSVEKAEEPKKEGAKKEEVKVDYEIVLDENFEKTEQREIRATTEATKEIEFETITKEIKEEYKDKGLDSIHVYIHAPAGNSFGQLKAHSFIAYTQKGAAQTGLDKPDSYKIEVAEVKEEASNEDSNEPSDEEWQASFQRIAISEAGRYVELKEKGTLAADRLEEHAGVVQQQADKLTDPAKKEQFTKLAALIKEDKLEEVKALISELQ